MVIENELELSVISVLRAVYVGPGSLAPDRFLLHVGSGRAISEDSTLWELMAYPFFHPTANEAEAWSPQYLSVTGTR